MSESGLDLGLVGFVNSARVERGGMSGKFLVETYDDPWQNRGIHIYGDGLGIFLSELAALTLAQQIVSTLEEARSEREGA